ncbi:MAG: helix-turn-helix transcriptional regulator [Firmicutes bacterium]|nr:helix-turn-helix transcriptional regulator [Bacillota bacterium]
MRVEVCPLARTAALIGDVYVLLILRDLAAGPQRFTSLARSVGVNPRTLSNRLRRMEREGLVARRHYAEIPPRVEYSLTDKGESLLPILHMMRLWGEQWLMGGTPRRKRTAQGSAALETPAGA